MSAITRSEMVTEASKCAGCQRNITDRYLLKAVDQFWHEDCLKCSCCDCRLGEVGSTLFAKANLLLCKRDYLRLFGTTGCCSACQKMIPAFEMVMRAKSNVYHLDCFACQQCNHRFCVGDRYFLANNKILCEYDYEEKMMFSAPAFAVGGSLSSQTQQPQQQQQHQQHPMLQPPLQPPHSHHHHHHHHQTPASSSQLQQQQSIPVVAPSNDDASSGYGSPSPTAVS